MRILYLDLDTLRPDHLGCYGYHRNTSPNIDEVAKEAVLFTNYYCSDAPCLPSRSAFMTGQFGIHSGIVGHGGTGAVLRPEGASRGFKDKSYSDNLTFLFRAKGMKSVLISPFPERHGAWWYSAGFNEIINTGKSGNEIAAEVGPEALSWLTDNGSSDNWYLHINFWDAHTPYRTPDDFGNPFANDPIDDWITPEVLEAQRGKVGPHSPREINMFTNKTDPKYTRYPGELTSLEDVRRMMDGYDCGIRYMDDFIGKLFDKIKELGVWEDTAVIISADHGENMGELGIYGEHATADEYTCKIPMIVKWPGGLKGHIDTGLHYNLDLAPTLAELLNQQPSPLWDGQSYAQTLWRGACCERDYLVVSQCAHVCQRSVRFANYLYIRTYHDGYHLFPKEMLFDLKDDPREQHNIASKRPDLCHRAMHMLAGWHDQMMETMPFDNDPLWTVIKEGGPLHAKGKLQAYCERLEATGRGWAVGQLRERHPQEFP